MSFAYPIYEDKVNKTGVRFYHCSNKRSGVRTMKTSYPPGTILDADKTVLYKPDYYIVDKLSSEGECKKYKLHDCTVMNIYYMEGEWYYGTKNSWNIKNLKDFTLTTYGKFFEECLEHYPEFSLDSLDKERMHTVIFTNPGCHFLSDAHKIYVYDNAAYPGLDQLEETDGDEYVAVCGGEIQIVQSKLRETATNLLYNNRMKCYSKELKLARAKVIISALCHCPENMRSQVFTYYEMYLNDTVKDIYHEVCDVANAFELENSVKDKYKDVEIPTDLVNISQDNSIYDPRFIGFFVMIYRASC